MMRLFPGLFNDTFDDMMHDHSMMKTDIREKDGNFILDMELPGFKKEDIHLNIEGERLTNSAEHTQENNTKDDKNHFIRRERRYGSMSRSFDLSSIDAEHIQAKFTDGVLELELPKKQTAVPASHRIEIH